MAVERDLQVLGRSIESAAPHQYHAAGGARVQALVVERQCLRVRRGGFVHPAGSSQPIALALGACGPDHRQIPACQIVVGHQLQRLFIAVDCFVLTSRVCQRDRQIVGSDVIAWIDVGCARPQGNRVAPILCLPPSLHAERGQHDEGRQCNGPSAAHRRQSRD